MGSNSTPLCFCGLPAVGPGALVVLSAGPAFRKIVPKRLFWGPNPIFFFFFDLGERKGYIQEAKCGPATAVMAGFFQKPSAYMFPPEPGIRGTPFRKAFLLFCFTKLSSKSNLASRKKPGLVAKSASDLIPQGSGLWALAQGPDCQGPCCLWCVFVPGGRFLFPVNPYSKVVPCLGMLVPLPSYSHRLPCWAESFLEHAFRFAHSLVSNSIPPLPPHPSVCGFLLSWSQAWWFRHKKGIRTLFVEAARRTRRLKIPGK